MDYLDEKRLAPEVDSYELVLYWDAARKHSEL